MNLQCLISVIDSESYHAAAWQLHNQTSHISLNCIPTVSHSHNQTPHISLHLLTVRSAKMLLALICLASLAAFTSKAENQQQLNTSRENQNPTQEQRREDNSRCHRQGRNFPKGVLYFSPPGEEIREKHNWLKFTIRKPPSEDTPETHVDEGKSKLRIRIWPNPQDRKSKTEKADCRTSDHDQELFGKINQTSTFVLSTRQYLDGVCLQVEKEDDHRRWKKVSGTDCETYDVTFEGNGDDTERGVAVAFVLVTYIAFSVAFLQLWFCLLKTGRFM